MTCHFATKNHSRGVLKLSTKVIPLSETQFSTRKEIFIKENLSIGFSARGSSKELWPLCNQCVPPKLKENCRAVLKPTLLVRMLDKGSWDVLMLRWISGHNNKGYIQKGRHKEGPWSHNEDKVREKNLMYSCTKSSQKCNNLKNRGS